ncbi:MAG: alpha/beta hydrolase [Nitrosomonas sp.]|nr:alpha/beta hydrolase [Nitrosomonas sp.]
MTKATARYCLLIFLCLLLSGCSGLMYYPDTKNQFFDPKAAGYAPEDIFFTDSAQRRLHGWWFPAKKTPAKATIIFFHGNAENLTSHFMHLAWISAENYNLFIFDYPGYGRSEGKPSPKSCVESGHAAVDWVNQHKAKDSPIIIYGQSMGGIIALKTAIDKKSEIDLKLVVADSTFDSFQRIAREKLSHHWLTWPLQPLSYVLLSDRWAPQNLKSLSSVPVLVIHGQQDRTVEPIFGDMIFEKLAEPKTFWKIPDGVHSDVFWGHEHKYRSKFLTFIESLGKY